MPAPRNLLENVTSSLTPQIKVIVYRWVDAGEDPDTPDSVLNQSLRLDISSQVISFQYSKTLANPSGSFSLTLANSTGFLPSGDWKDELKPGYWIVIYLSQRGELLINPEIANPLNSQNSLDERPLTRCVGRIDRVAVQSTVTEKGALDVTFQVSGRDFGSIYEDSYTWANLFRFEKILLDSIGLSGLNVLGTVKINEALRIMHDLLLYPSKIPGAKVNDGGSLTSTSLQGLLPRELVADVFSASVGFQGQTYYGNIPATTQFETTEAALAIESPSDFLFGSVWENLKSISVPELHELFTELNEVGEPRLTFRPIPWAIDKTGYPLQGAHITAYKDLDPVVIIPAVDLISFDLGEANSERFNSFLVTVSTSMINVENNISILNGSGFPSFQRASIKRYGFRPNHVQAHSIVKNAEQSDGSSHIKLLREFNHVLQDYWQNAIFAESGSVEIIGNNAVKVGSVMKFSEDTPYISTKRYYIEAYNDSFVVGEKGERTWTSTVMLTRGFEESDLLAKGGFGTRNTPFTHRGEYTRGGAS